MGAGGGTGTGVHKTDRRHPKYADDFNGFAATIKGLVGRPIVTKSETTGWRPSCSCVDESDHNGPFEPVPQTVLDPFNGSGTTGAVSVMHGRNYIGIELNPAYIELARKRIEGTQIKAEL